MSVHEEQEILTAGQGLEEADRVVIILHGRGATANSVLNIADKLPEAAFLAPQAANRTWYPHSFMEGRQKNKPYLDSALEKVGGLVEQALEHVDSDKVVLLGFSQGACLASEYTAQNSRRYGAIIVFSGGLIGKELPEYEGQMDKTPVFIGCSRNDPYIPLSRVNETEKVFESLNAEVEKHIYDGGNHTINEHEIQRVSEIISEI